MKQVYFLAGLIAISGSVAKAVEFNKDALKSMQEEGHKIVEESQGGRTYKTVGGECLDIAGGKLVISKCHAKVASQMWKLEDQGRLVANDGRCLANAQLQKCNGSKAQQWKHDGNKRLVNATNKCLQVQGDPAKPGTAVGAAPCSKAQSQTWE